MATCHKRLAPKTLTIKEQPMNERSLCFQRPKIELNLFSLGFQLSLSTETRLFEKKNTKNTKFGHPLKTERGIPPTTPTTKPHGLRLGRIQLSTRT